MSGSQWVKILHASPYSIKITVSDGERIFQSEEIVLSPASETMVEFGKLAEQSNSMMDWPVPMRELGVLKVCTNPWCEGQGQIYGRGPVCGECGVEGRES